MSPRETSVSEKQPPLQGTAPLASHQDPKLMNKLVKQG